MKIRAAVAHRPGAKLSIETVELEGPKAGEVLIELKATGVCHTDELHALRRKTRKDCSRASSGTRARASWSKSDRASQSSKEATT